MARAASSKVYCFLPPGCAAEKNLLAVPNTGAAGGQLQSQPAVVLALGVCGTGSLLERLSFGNGLGGLARVERDHLQFVVKSNNGDRGALQE